jgi:hypothetical protein
LPRGAAIPAGASLNCATDPGTDPRGPWLALEAGIRHEREWVDYWGAIADGRLE